MVQVTSLGSRVIAGQNQDVYRSETHVRSWRDHFTKIFSQGPALSRPPANLSTDQQKLLKIRSVQAVAWRARFWVATLLVANVLTFTFAERDLNYGYLIPIWSVGVWLLALIPYIFLTYFANILTENSSTSAIRLVHALLCVWIAGLSILWWFGAMGIKFIPFGSRPSTGQFLFIRQFFIFTTLSGQVMPIVLFSASTIARLSVFVPSMCLLTIAWYFGVVLTQTAFIIWNTTQLCLYLLISWIVGRDEQASQIRAFIAEDARLRLNTFLGSLSHDMRSPLSAMTLMLAVMKAKNTSPDLDQDLDKIRSQAIALESMMNGTLDLSRLVAGTWDVRVEDI